MKKQKGLFLCATVGLAFGAYFTLRYSGFWRGGDTAFFITIITSIFENGTLNTEFSYAHGYAYQTWATSLALLSGVSPKVLLLVYGPLLGCFTIAFIGYSTFRIWLGSDKLGSLAASLLFLSAEFYLSVARGNHENLTVICTLLACLSIIKSFEALALKQLQIFVMWVITYYVIVFTLASINTTWASSFVVATTFSMIFASILLLMKPSTGPTLSFTRARLILVASTSWLLVLIIFWYVYPQSSSVIFLLERVVDRVGALALSLTPEVNPYEYSSYAWISISTYHVLSIFRYLLFVGSFLTALTLLIKIVRHPNKLPLRLLLLMAFYGAFGLELIIALIIDLVDTGSGNNLQVRLYNYFVLFAVPMLLIGVWDLICKKTQLVVIFSIMFTFMIPLSLLKGLQDPFVSNIWSLYTPTEIKALEFWQDNVEYGLLWTGPDRRLDEAYIIENNTFDLGLHKETVNGALQPSSFVQFAIISDLILQNLRAQSITPPAIIHDHFVYSNGVANLYKKIAQTPFQK